VHDITYHSYVHENIARFLQGFRHDAHPMAMLTSALAALSSFYPKAKDIHDPEQRYISIIRLLSKTPTIAAMIYRHMKGLPVVYPDNSLPYVENYLSMVARMGEPRYESNPAFTKALDVLLILHADHEQNCSTSAVRAVGSSHVDPFSAVAAGVGGAVRPAARRRQRGGAAHDRGDRPPEERARLPRRGEERQGEPAHGLRAPRVQELRPARPIVKQLADQVFAQIGMDKDLEIALKLEEAALNDDYFVSRKLYPNVDFYTGLIYRSMAFPTSYFTVLFAVGAWRAGSRSGRRCCSTRSRRSPGRGRSTWGRRSAGTRASLPTSSRGRGRTRSASRRADGGGAARGSRPPSSFVGRADGSAAARAGEVGAAALGLRRARRGRTGHRAQSRRRAVHTVAPSSSAPWLCAHAARPVRGCTASAIRQRRVRSRERFGVELGREHARQHPGDVGVHHAARRS
jgi:hypothetical protein